MRHIYNLAFIFFMIIPQLSLAEIINNSESNPREAEAVKIANDWLNIVESGDDKQSFSMLPPIFQQNLTQDTWRESVLDRNAKTGKLISRKLRRVVWYDNPANAPLPGLYAAVEFDSLFENTDKHFQFVILHSQNDEAFKVIRNEADVALKNTPPKK